VNAKTQPLNFLNRIREVTSIFSLKITMFWLGVELRGNFLYMLGRAHMDDPSSSFETKSTRTRKL
jgi:hypothetical protein